MNDLSNIRLKVLLDLINMVTKTSMNSGLSDTITLPA